MYWHGLIWIAALWAITFPASTWSLALVFRCTSTVDNAGG
jgi:amino acid permease